MKFDSNVLQLTESPIFYLASHFQDGGHGVISRTKVLPSGECTRSVRQRVRLADAAAYAFRCQLV